MAIIPRNQLSLADVFSDCQDIYESDKPEFLSLLQSNIDLDEIIPASFRKHFYASTGRTRNYPEKDLRTYPGTLRGTPDWDDTYKIRTTVERSINQMKDSFCLAGRKTQNAKTLHADLLLAGISQLLGVILADKIHHHQYIRSLKPLVA